jgi:hypothetical protein
MSQVVFIGPLDDGLCRRLAARVRVRVRVRV